VEVATADPEAVRRALEGAGFEVELWETLGDALRVIAASRQK
jgi:hypothetical protein